MLRFLWTGQTVVLPEVSFQAGATDFAFKSSERGENDEGWVVILELITKNNTLLLLLSVSIQGITSDSHFNTGHGHQNRRAETLFASLYAMPHYGLQRQRPLFDMNDY